MSIGQLRELRCGQGRPSLTPVSPSTPSAGLAFMASAISFSCRSAANVFLVAIFSIQVLHYKIDSMRERVSFLRGCGLDQAQVAACCARFPQIFSLNVEANLAPKWRYLVDYIRTPADGVATLCSYPAYFSLSLTNRWAGRGSAGHKPAFGPCRAEPGPPRSFPKVSLCPHCLSPPPSTGSCRATGFSCTSMPSGQRLAEKVLTSRSP